jgi:hypothetical protein
MQTALGAKEERSESTRGAYAKAAQSSIIRWFSSSVGRVKVVCAGLPMDKKECAVQRVADVGGSTPTLARALFVVMALNATLLSAATKTSTGDGDDVVDESGTAWLHSAHAQRSSAAAAASGWCVPRLAQAQALPPAHVRKCMAHLALRPTSTCRIEAAGRTKARA